MPDLADEHVVRFFGQHELRRARERIERTLGQCGQLELAVAIGEIGEHEEAQPVRRLLVERTEDARVVRIAAAAIEQRVGFLAAVAAEMLVQQIHHRPQMAAFFDVDLEQVAQVVHRWCGQAQMALLLDRCGLGVALRDDDAAQVRTVFAGHVLPNFLALVIAEMDLAVLVARVQKNAPAVVGHLHVAELRPALRIHAGRGAQVHVVPMRAFRAHVAPPVEKIRLPAFERALQGAVLSQVDVVRDLFAVVDGAHVTVSWRDE